MANGGVDLSNMAFVRESAGRVEFPARSVMSRIWDIFSRVVQDHNQSYWSLGAADTIELIRKGAPARLAFVFIVSAIAALILHLTLVIAWLAAVIVWELLVWPRLDKWWLNGADRSSDAGFRGLALINFVGACLYASFPAMTWMSGEALGMVLATAWVSGSAGHLPVYYASHRLVMLATAAPLMVCVLIIPSVAAGGFTVVGLLSSLVLLCLIAAAILFGHDRKVMLRALSTQMAARTHAEQANRAKSQFLAAMGGELRTPLEAIVGYAELIEEEASGATVNDARRIRLSGQQLLRLLSVILDVSRLETGAVSLAPENLNVSAILKDFEEAATPLVEASGATLNIVEAGVLGEAEMDHVRVHQCLMQLVANAVRLAPGGEITVVASREEGARDRAIVKFDVIDTGAGLTDVQRARLFEPFANVSGSAQGAGEDVIVGLAFARDVARLMGGDIECSSVLGKGTTLSLWIDVRPRLVVGAAV